MGRPKGVFKTKGLPEFIKAASLAPPTAIECTDAELLLACRRGDERAWDALVERFQRLVSSIPRRAGLSEEAVADIFQEVFLTLVEKLDEINQPERIRAWLVTTAKFKTWEFVSKESTLAKRFYNFGDESEALLAVPDNHLLPDEVLIELERQHIIRTAIGSLDERCQKIVKMLYTGDGASYAEVAELIGASETSISPLRSRCLKKLVKTVSR